MKAPGWGSTILLTLVISTGVSLAVQWAGDTGKLAGFWAAPAPASAPAPAPAPAHVGRPVPQLIGLPRKIAAELLKPRQLLLVVREQREDADLPKGAVLSQDPLPGSDLAPGGQVSVVLSSGLAERIEVPALAGMGLAEATAALEQAGLDVGELTGAEAPAEGEEDARTVTSTEPAAGEEVAPESAVALKLELGLIEVPKVTGLNMRKAKAALEKAGLKLGKVHSRFDDLRPAWMVLGQKPDEGEKVAPGTEVNLVRNEE